MKEGRSETLYREGKPILKVKKVCRGGQGRHDLPSDRPSFSLQKAPTCPCSCLDHQQHGVCGNGSLEWYLNLYLVLSIAPCVTEKSTPACCPAQFVRFCVYLWELREETDTSYRNILPWRQNRELGGWFQADIWSRIVGYACEVRIHVNNTGRTEYVRRRGTLRSRRRRGTDTDLLSILVGVHWTRAAASVDRRCTARRNGEFVLCAY